MFARRLRLELAEGPAIRPVPKEWLDEFFLRSFVGLSAFDEVLVSGDGEMQVGPGIAPDHVKEQFERWLQERRLIGAKVRLEVRER